MAWYENAFDELYPVLYPHRDDAEAERAVGALSDLLGDRRHVLDLACGSGRYLTALSGRGIRAWGLDLSEFLLTEAVEREGLKGRLVRGDMRRLPFGNGTVDAVINMFTSFGYFAGDVENVVVIQEVARILTPGGIFVLDFLNAHRVREETGGHTTRHRAGYTIEENRFLDDNERYLVKRVRATPDDPEAEGMSYDERVRIYTAEELTTMIRGAGLRIVGQFGDYDRGEFNRAMSDRVIFAAEKPE